MAAPPIWARDAGLLESDSMNIYLASLCGLGDVYLKAEDLSNRISVLESFFYVNKWMIPYIRNHWDFMLDSGAFTFMSSAKSSDKIDWISYIDKYADFVIDNHVEKFIELDIDAVVGFDDVLKLRNRLESRVGRQSIPVWHKSRGIENWKQTSKDYPYVAIGGIVTKEITQDEYRYFNPMTDIAHENGAKVHILGFTPSGGQLEMFRFDSCDSSSWMRGNIGGFLYLFNGRTIQVIKKTAGYKNNQKNVARHNFVEWLKFQRYMKGF